MIAITEFKIKASNQKQRHGELVVAIQKNIPAMKEFFLYVLDYVKKTFSLDGDDKLAMTLLYLGFSSLLLIIYII